MTTQLTHAPPASTSPAGLALPQLWTGPRRIRLLARLVAKSIVCASGMMLRIAYRNGPTRPLCVGPGGVHVILTGGFASDNWLANHLRPMVACESISRVTVVSDRPMLRLGGVTYACPPAWLARLIGRTPSRLACYVLRCLRERPGLCGGFHLLPNGIAAMLCAVLSGGKSLYVSVGGRTEILGGAACNENFPFGRTGTYDVVLERQLVGLVRHADAVVTMGTGARRLLQGRGIRAPIFPIPGGMPEPATEAAPAKQYDLIVTCRLVSVKRLDVFLRVVRQVAQARPDVSAVIVGDGPLAPQLGELARSLGIESNVTFAGFRQDVSTWLGRSRVFMLTSDSEGLSLSLMEAMMAGLPAVVSDVGDLGDLVSHGCNGLLVPRRDVGAFARAVLSLLDDPELLESYSRQARRSAMQLTIPKVAQRWDRVIESLTG